VRAARSASRVVSAQGRALAGLAAAWDPPLVGPALRRLLGPAREEESLIGGVASTVFLPARGPGPWPAAVLYPGVTREGRRHAAFVGLGCGLAASGFLAVVAEPDGLARGELTSSTAAQALSAAEAVAARADAARGHVALLGVSGGATLALRTASAPELAERVTSVLVLAPVCDLEAALHFVTTGSRREDGVLVPFETQGFFQLVSARSVVASLPPTGDRDLVLARLRSLPDYGERPLDRIHSWIDGVSDDGVRATLELFANRDPDRYDALLQALPAAARDSLASLSTVRDAARIEAPVEIVVAREDKYLPLADALAFVEACPRARLTILESLEHAVPRLAVRAARDLARLDGALVRTLAASYSR
jgi:pimeloyl-ACP methyl ester carboxylesterase